MSDNIINFLTRRCQNSQEGEMAFETGNLLNDGYKRGIPAERLSLACLQDIVISLAAGHKAEGDAEQAHWDIVAAALTGCRRE